MLRTGEWVEFGTGSDYRPALVVAGGPYPILRVFLRHGEGQNLVETRYLYKCGAAIFRNVGHDLEVVGAEEGAGFGRWRKS